MGAGVTGVSGPLAGTTAPMPSVVQLPARHESARVREGTPSAAAKASARSGSEAVTARSGPKRT